ncbi:hypothetical protein HZA99_04635 [Candidatus Woesearchaeota archaeon]|nr:hypothetical protein [Candidatus Woesearchaeota archaeon]
MGIFEVVNPERTLLPIEVPATPILPVLQQLQFDAAALEEEVSVTYILGVLDMFRDAVIGHSLLDASLDIVEGIIQTNFSCGTGEEAVRDRISNYRWHEVLSSPKIPWTLYELAAERVRIELTKEDALRDYTTPTMFPFLLGVYSLVSHPFIVAQSRFQSIEGLIGAVNSLGKKLNIVTEMKTTSPPQKQGDLLTAQFQRTQYPESLHALEERLQSTGISRLEAKEVARTICYRDLATTLGALVAGSILKNQRLRYIEVDGDPLGEANIRIYYPPPAGDSTVSLSDAWKLLTTKPGNPWRQRYIKEKLEYAVAPLQAVGLQLANRELDAARIRESRQAATLARTEEAERTLAQLEQIARGIAHEVKNPLSTLSNNTRALFFDEDNYFERLQEGTNDPADPHYQHHRRIIVDIGHQFISKEPLKGPAFRQMVERRRDAYTTAVKLLNEELDAVGREKISPLRGYAFDPLVRGYLLRKKYASYNIIREYFGRLDIGETLTREEFGDLGVHIEKLDAANNVSQELIAELYRRIGYISAIATNPMRHRTTEELDLDSLIQEGSFLFLKEIEKPELVITVENRVQYGNAELTRSTIENILKNAREALSRDTTQDIESHTVVIYSPQDAPVIYFGNTGPAIPPDRAREMFDLHKRVQKSADSSGISLALAQNDLHRVGCDLLYYDTNQTYALQQKYPTLGKYPLHVLFGIKLLTAEECAATRTS